MNHNIMAYIYDFLSYISDDNELSGKIKEIILFGSVAKKAYDKQSDIDLFFNLKNPGEIAAVEESLRNIRKSFEIASEKKWHIKGINYPISFIVGDLNSKSWETIKEEIISSGIMLYGQYKELPSSVKHFSLISYSLDKLKRKNKMKLIRRLFGYGLKKGRKEYRQAGLLEQIGGQKLSSNVILVPMNDLLKIRSLFREFKINHIVIETWVKK